MIFKGISMQFSTENEQQYEEIGRFWDCFSKLYGKENLLGLGFNWKTQSIEYVMGFEDREQKFDMATIRDFYPECEYKEIELPDEGWKVYSGRTELLAKMYEEIYRDGSLKYEIEAFADDSTCRVEIYR